MIERRGGFDRLDLKIRKFREEMRVHLVELLSRKNPPLKTIAAETQDGNVDYREPTDGNICCVLCFMSCLCICLRDIDKLDLDRLIPGQGRNFEYILPMVSKDYINTPPEFSRQQSFDWVKFDE